MENITVHPQVAGSSAKFDEIFEGLVPPIPVRELNEAKLEKVLFFLDEIEKIIYKHLQEPFYRVLNMSIDRIASRQIRTNFDFGNFIAQRVSPYANSFYMDMFHELFVPQFREPYTGTKIGNILFLKQLPGPIHPNTLLEDLPIWIGFAADIATSLRNYIQNGMDDFAIPIIKKFVPKEQKNQELADRILFNAQALYQAQAYRFKDVYGEEANKIFKNLFRELGQELKLLAYRVRLLRQHWPANRLTPNRGQMAMIRDTVTDVYMENDQDQDATDRELQNMINTNRLPSWFYQPLGIADTALLKTGKGTFNLI